MNFGELHGWTVSSVQKAVMENDVDLLERLLSYSSDMGRPVDVRDNRGWTPVHEAAYRGHTGCLNLMLQALDSRDDPVDKYCLINAKTHNQETALYLACSIKGNSDVVKLLVEHGASVNEESYMDETALFAAARSGDVNLVEYLIISGATVLKSAFEGLSPLHDACIKNNVQIVQLLLNVGCSINTKTSNGATPLFMSAVYGSRDCIKLLTERLDCDVNCKTALGMTPLYAAVMGDYIDCVTLLLSRGANPNIAEYQNKELPVHIAASRGNIECLQVLYPVSGVSHRLKSTGKPMPLLWLAVESCSTKCVGYLLEQRCDIFEAICECDEPCTPFRLAVKENFQTVAGFIANGTIDPSEGMAEVFKVHHIRGKSVYLQQVLEILLQRGALIKQNSVYEIQEMLCVSLRYPSIQFLLKCGVELISNTDKQCADMCAFLCKLFDRERSGENRQGDVDRIVSRLLGALQYCHFSLCQPLNERIQGHDQYLQIVDLTETPQSLQKTCRTVVRNTIFRNLNASKCVWQLYNGSAIEILPVPDVIKSFLKFQEEIFHQNV